MASFLFVFAIYAFILLQTNRVSSSPSPVTCDFGTGKCIGIMEFLIAAQVNPSISPETEFNATLNDCTDICQLNESCWIAEWLVGSKTTVSPCRLYRKIPENGLFTNLDYVIHRWKCCSSSVCKPQPNRCHGFFARRIYSYLVGAHILTTFQNVPDIQVCLDECIKNPLCAYVNFINSSGCELIQFKRDRTYRHTGNDSSVFEWNCCAHDDSNLPTDPLSIPGKCVALWQSSKVRSNFTDFAVGQFFTMSKLACLNVCSENPYCYEALFSQGHALCLLLSDKIENLKEYKRARHKLMSIDDWYSYTWNCCTPHRMVPNPPHNPLKDAWCLCLNDTKRDVTTVAADGCVQPLLHQSVSVNLNETAFWVDSDAKVFRAGKLWKRVFNGNIYMWIPMSDISGYQCSIQYCNIYSTVVNYSQMPKIVSRAEWFALPPTEPLDKYPLTPNIVIISDSVSYEMGCYSEAMCSNYVRDIQYDFETYLHEWDIPLNYLIGEDGRIYEGRGSDYVPAAAKHYNPVSISIAFIGWYEHRYPNVKSLKAVRQLIHYLVQNRKLTPNYILYGLRDVRPIPAPGKDLYHLMQNWGHFKSLHIPRGVSCAEYFANRLKKLLIITGSSLLFTISLIASVVIYYTKFRHDLVCPQRRLVSKKYNVKSQRARCIRCSLHLSDPERQITSGWPANCIKRHAETLHIPASDTELVLVISTELNCCCAEQISLLYTRCIKESFFEFPSFLKQMKRICLANLILLWTEKVFVFHGYDVAAIQHIMKAFVEGQCVCNIQDFDIHAFSLPYLDNKESFSSSADSFDASRILNQKLHRFERLDNYCRYFECQDSNEVEVTYQEFIIIQMEEDAISYDTTASYLSDSLSSLSSNLS